MSWAISETAQGGKRLGLAFGMLALSGSERQFGIDQARDNAVT
jgi:hypothetical protein